MTDIRPCDVTSIRAEYVDCCLPDYFAGASGADEVLVVPVQTEMTWEELYNDALLTFHTSSGYFNEVSGSGSMIEKALHELLEDQLAERPDEEVDVVKYIHPDSDVYIYIALYAVTEEESDDE